MTTTMSARCRCRARRFPPALLVALAAPGWPLPGIAAQETTPVRSGAQQLRLFEPGLVSTAGSDELTPAFSPDGRRLVFVRRPPGGAFTLHESLREASGWAEPRPLPFSGRWNDQAPAFAPDGQSLLFQSRRPTDGGNAPEGPRDDDLWRVDVEGGGWGAPRPLEPPVQRAPPGVEGAPFQGREMAPSVASDGTLYFWSGIPGRSVGQSDLYVAPRLGGGWGEPENVGPPVNSEHFETHPWIAPDGSFLLFACDGCPDALGGSDVYVSRRTDGGWSRPVNLGRPVNSETYDFAALLSPDGRRLYVSSNRPVDGGAEAGRQNIWWIPVEEVPALSFLGGAGAIPEAEPPASICPP